MATARYEAMSALALSNIRYEALTNAQQISNLADAAKKKLEEVSATKEKAPIIDWTLVEQRLNTIIHWCNLQTVST
jgi:hypothetical protein